MDVAVNELVVAPFRELVEKANTALQNADDADPAAGEPMQKAAKNLVKEGERALKKIEPLCEKILQEYGSAFVDALKEDDDIAQLRTELNDTLWEFDDYTEVDDFDADKFAALQALSRKAAPKIVEALRRMKLEAPSIDRQIPSPSVFTDALSTPATPGLAEQAGLGLVTSNERQSVSVASSYVGDPAGEGVLVGYQAGPDLGLEERPPLTQGGETLLQSASPQVEQGQAPLQGLTAQPAEPPVEDIPPEPPINPWQLNREPAASPTMNQSQPLERPERRRMISRDGSVVSGSSPVLAQATTDTSARRLDVGVDYMIREVEETARRMTVTDDIRSSTYEDPVTWHQPQFDTSSEASATGGLSPHVQRLNPRTDSLSHPIGRVVSQGRLDATSKAATNGLQPSAIPESPILPAKRWSQASSTTGSYQQSIYDGRARDSLVSPITPDNRLSFLSAVDHSFPSASRETVATAPADGYPTTVSANFANRFPSAAPPSAQLPPVPRMPIQTEQPGLEAVSQPVRVPIVPVDDGLMPVEPERRLEVVPEIVRREPDCTITPQSSYHQFKGFCEGAREVIRGGLGVKKIKKPWGLAGTVVVAKCKHCLYELPWQQVESDLNNAESGNYKSSGVGFRLRLLSKCHLPTRTIEDQLYGCLFCIQVGRTVEESDATVFFTQKQLFSHLARHPRPLPAVPGLMVIEAPEVPLTLRNNFDLHFPNPPTASAMASLVREIAALPSATAVDSSKPSHGSIRSAPDQSPPLQFAAGAKIVGLEFPDRYGGEWAIGWADQVRGAFPADLVKLDAPPPDEIRMHGTSNYKAVARWKFNHKDKDRGDWLKFDKGESITNINWVYSDHWCWAGTNAKGKWGIFPRSHIEPSSTQETHLGSDRASLLSKESKSTNIFSRVSLRHHRSNGSRGSDGGSSPTSPRPLIY